MATKLQVVKAALANKKTQPDITYNPTKKNIPYSAKTPADAKQGNAYAKNPTDPKFKGVDPAKFGYPEDKTTKPKGAVFFKKSVRK